MRWSESDIALILATNGRLVAEVNELRKENRRTRNETLSLRRECRRLKREIRTAQVASPPPVFDPPPASAWVSLPWYGYVS